MSRTTKILLALLDNLIWVLLLVLVILNVIFTPNFAKLSNFINILDASAILGMLVLAQGICMMVGHFDLSIESTLAFAPIIAVLCATKWMLGLSWVLAIILTIIVGGLIGLLNGFFIAYLKVNSFLQTLSMQIVFRGASLFLIPLTIYGLPDVYTFFGGYRIGDTLPVDVIILILAFLVFEVVIKKLSFGRRLLATGGNSKAAFISGINVKKTVLLAFVCSGAIAALAGLIAAGRQGGVTNSMGEGMVMLSFAGAVLGGVSLQGGKGNSLGMFGGVLFLGVIDNCLILLGVDVYLISCIKGLMILVAVLLDQIKIYAKNALLRREELRKISLAEAKEPLYQKNQTCS